MVYFEQETRPIHNPFFGVSILVLMDGVLRVPL